MSAILQTLENERIERALDRGVFAAGAASLAVALAMTLWNVLDSDRSVAQADRTEAALASVL